MVATFSWDDVVMHVSAVPLMRNKNAELVVSSEGAVAGNDENQGKHVIDLSILISCTQTFVIYYMLHYVDAYRIC